MDNVWLVINMEVPSDVKSYIHRIGRTGRAWASGKAIMMTSHEELWLLKDIEKHHAIKIKESVHTAIFDDNAEFSNIKLNKSTDKPGGRRWWGGWRGKGKWWWRWGKRQKKWWQRRSWRKPSSHGENNKGSKKSWGSWSRKGRPNSANSRPQRSGRNNQQKRS
jgi:superfamily II DNA/RNA helicase